jgi:flagellar hook-basal body complex protein FliE
MRVELLLPDAPPAQPAIGAGAGSAFGRLLDAFGATFERAQSAEDAFANGGGTLQAAMYERARADVALAVAGAAAQRTAAAIQSIVNMQV